MLGLAGAVIYVQGEVRFGIGRTTRWPQLRMFVNNQLISMKGQQRESE